jgi:hypothetical protein
MLRTGWLLMFFITIHAMASAQFSDSVNYYLKFTSAGIVNKTNDGNSYNLNNQLRFSTSKKRVSMNTSLQWLYGRQLELLVNNDFTAAVDFNLYNRKAKRLYYWGLALYETSVSLKINNRFQGGIGAGYNIIDRANAIVVVSDGILYEKSDLYENSEGGFTDYETYRNSVRLKYRWVIKNRLTLDGTGFLQHALSDRHDYIIKSNASASIKLIEWLSFTTALTYNKISATERENLLLTFGLTVEKYF